MGLCKATVPKVRPSHVSSKVKSTSIVADRQKKRKTPDVVRHHRDEKSNIIPPPSNRASREEEDNSHTWEEMPITSSSDALVASSQCRSVTPERSESSSLPASPTASSLFLVGTCRDLEKGYHRLTTNPRPEQVRPVEVLVKSLSHIKNRYIQEEDFVWANEQMKSVRQDLVVQGIGNAFALNVYETHARMLLEHGDLPEFNQCQTRIQSLVQGDDSLCQGTEVRVGDWNVSSRDRNRKRVSQSKEATDEFRAYRILYALVRESWMELKHALLHPAGEGHLESRDVCCTHHAVCVVKAVEEVDYRTFFRLYQAAPKLSAYLMDFLVERVRDAAYQRIVSAYRPHVSVEQVRELLHFSDLEETRRFLKQRGAVFWQERDHADFWVDCKASARKTAAISSA